MRIGKAVIISNGKVKRRGFFKNLIESNDYIIAVNGQPTNQKTNIYDALINTAGKQVTLTLNSKPDKDGSRDVVVIPIGDESELYYFNWVQNNIEKVNKATDGIVGYILIMVIVAAFIIWRKWKLYKTLVLYGAIHLDKTISGGKHYERYKRRKRKVSS